MWSCGAASVKVDGPQQSSDRKNNLRWLGWHWLALAGKLALAGVAGLLARLAPGLPSAPRLARDLPPKIDPPQKTGCGTHGHQ